MSYEIISIGKCKNNPPMYSLRYEDGELKSISVNRSNLQAHFQTDLWAYDFMRYVQISNKQLKEIEKELLNGKDDWSKLNEVYDNLFELRNKHYERVLDEQGYLKKKYYNYGTIAYRCCPNVKRGLKTVNYINGLLGIYASYL